MSTIQTPRTLGALPAPAFHRPWFRYFAPVDGEGAPPAPAAAPAPNDPPAASAATAEQPPTPAAPAAPAPVDGDTPPWGDDFDPERAHRLVENLRGDVVAERAKREKAVQEAATAAAQKAREEAYREFGKQLGVVKDDEPPTVEGLQIAVQDRDTNLTRAQADLAAQRAENTLLRIAGRTDINADVDALLDSRGFTEKLAAIDTTAGDYASQVETLVKAEVESNSRYRKVQVAPRSSNGDPAPSGGSNAPKDDIDSLRATYRESRGVAD